MNLVDPELEFIDPTPNVHSLFIHFDMEFFWTTLLGRATVRWSKRMYSSAGACSYEGRGGIVDIALSEPLLKLRPRKDLVETLLHEMIHAYLFVVGKDQWRDGHGPNFLSHMHRINKAAGVNITVYHDFHDEVKLYQNHVWRCDGPCQRVPPYFGIVRRSTNRAPGPSEYWWYKHTKLCGGTFIKHKNTVEPAKQPTKIVKKPKSDIKIYINNNDNTIDNKNVNPKLFPKPTVFTGSGPVGGSKSLSVGVVETVRNVWVNNTIPSSIAPLTKKDPKENAYKRLSNVDHSDSLTAPKKIDDYFKTTGSSIPKEPQYITKQINNNNNIINNNNVIPKPVLKPTVFTGSDPAGKERRSSHSVVETVRNVWANNTSIAPLTKKDSTVSTSQVNVNKRLSNMDHSDSLTPPKKVTKIDDYFKTTASSILKDVYGKDFAVTQSSNTNKLKAVAAKETLVKCPICNAEVSDILINRHLDECLNYDAIEKLSKKTIQTIEPSSSHTMTNKIKNRTETVGAISSMPAFKPFVTCDTVKQEPPGHPESITNMHTNIKIEAEKYISSNAPSTMNYLDARRGVLRFKAETNTSNCLDLRTGIVQVKAEPSTSNCLDPRKGVIEVKAETNTTNCLDLRTGIVQVKAEPSTRNCVDLTTVFVQVKTESSTSIENHTCPCCGKTIDRPVKEHLDECLTFFDNNITIPEEGASTSRDKIIVIDDSDDEFDETMTLNATGTKSPCPCCMTMVEIADMNDHLDVCLHFSK